MDQVQIVQERHARKELPRKVLDLGAGKRHKAVALQEVEDALPEQVRDDADVIAEIERVPQMYALVAVLCVVELECGEDSKLYPRGVSVFLNGSNDLDGTLGFLPFVEGFDDFAKSALTEELDDVVCREYQYTSELVLRGDVRSLTSLSHYRISLHNIMAIVVVNFLVLGNVLIEVSVNSGW